AVRVNKDTLQAQCFSTNLKGDLITLIQDKLILSFPKTIEFIAKVINFEDVDVQEYQLPFGGFYTQLQSFRANEPVNLTIYDDSILNDYYIMPNIMFYQDGISEETQYKYKVSYDVSTDRIVVA